MPYKTIHNSPQLREWLRRDNRTIDHAAKSEFSFPPDIFAKAVAQKSSHHPHMSTEQLEMRAAHLLLLEGHSGQETEQKLRSHFSKRVFWEIVFAVIVIFLLLAIVVQRGHAQNRTGGIVIQLQNQGSNLGAPIGGGLVTLNASTNVTLARTGTTSLFTITASGGAGSGCTPPGTTLNAILTDLTGGACGAATKWTASGTTLTGLATAVFNMSAAATLNVPQSAGFAPTTANNWGYDTTNNRGVLGNGTDTSFLTWIHGAAPTTNDCVKFSGTLGALITNGGPCPATLASAAHQFFTSYTSTTGVFTKAQPACTDLSDSAGGCTMSTTAGGDLSGTLPSPTVAKVNGNTPGNTCTNQFTRSIDSSARGSCATVANADMANTATTVNGQTCTLGSTCTIPLSAVNAQTATYQVLAADFSNYKTITVASGTFTITLVASGSQPAAGQYIQIINYGSGVVTVARSGQNINGAAGNFTLSAGSATAPTSALVISDATNYFASIDEGTVGTVTSAVIAGTANQVTVTGTCTITTTGTCTLSLPSAVILGTDGSVAGTVQLANGGASAHTIYASGATTTNTIAGFASVPTTGDLVDCTSASTTCTLHDSGVATANVVTASANGTTKQLCTVAASNKACTWIDFPDVKYIPAANCNNTTAGSGWGIGSGGTVTCRAGTNNLGGYISITDTSTTFATFQIEIPEDWDTASNPYIRFQLASTDATNSHTIIPEINVACYKGDGSTTDDVAANGFHSLSTTTLNGSANRFWSGSNVQMNSTDVTGCVAGALMQVTVGRATDSATNAEFYGATVTFPRLIVVQAN